MLSKAKCAYNPKTSRHAKEEIEERVPMEKGRSRHESVIRSEKYLQSENE